MGAMFVLTALLALGLAGEPPVCDAAADTGTVIVAEAESTPARSFAEFRPSEHGFRFVNSFRGSPLPVALGRFERRLNVPERFGLCGGMCFAAADYFIAGRSLAEELPQKEAPVRGVPLYDYLYARQAASLAPLAVMFAKFVEWMDLPEEGEDGTHERTMAELRSIAAGIEAGEPVLLGLVLVSSADGGEPWRNHQVLAYGVERGDEGAVRALRVYDPNYPERDDVAIRWCGDEARWDRLVPERSQTRVRGFFRMHYEPVEPPPTPGDD
jgi:hypothetical protein